MTAPETRDATVFRMLREPHPHLIVRSAASLTAGCLLAAAGLLGALLAAELVFPGQWWWRHNFPVIGLSAASIAWLLALRLIWGPIRGRRQLVRPIFSTLAICACATLLSGLAERDFVPIVLLLATAFTSHCWAAAYVRWARGSAVLGADSLVSVHCPQCRYSLVGLTDCRCPECGFAFTIDGLIAAQEYGGVYARGETPRAAAPDSAGEAAEGQLAPT
jgi:hypothetical protein